MLAVLPKQCSVSLAGPSLADMVLKRECWGRRVGLTDFFLGEKCGYCGTRTHENWAPDLADNFKLHGVNSKAEACPPHICVGCKNARAFAKCAITGTIFLRQHNQLSTFKDSVMQRNMLPRHPLAKTSGYISPSGLAVIEAGHREVQCNIREWVAGTKGERVSRHQTVATLGTIRSEYATASISAVEDQLKWHSAQLGGNAFTDFIWERHVDFEEERYVAGYGPKGNPYHRTRRQKVVTYTGRATAVRVAAITGSGGSSQRQEGTRPHSESMSERIGRYRAMLNLGADFTQHELTQAYRRLMKQYHPDRVACLGPELRELAAKKAKEINEAYTVLQKKFV